jgi:hypothetical protein
MRRSSASCKFNELYSCVSCNEDEVNALKADINNDNLSCREFIIIATEVCAIHALKRRKGDGCLRLSSHFINTTHCLYIAPSYSHLCLCITYHPLILHSVL